MPFIPEPSGKLTYETLKLLQTLKILGINFVWKYWVKLIPFTYRNKNQQVCGQALKTHEESSAEKVLFIKMIWNYVFVKHILNINIALILMNHNKRKRYKREKCFVWSIQVEIFTFDRCSTNIKSQNLKDVGNSVKLGIYHNTLFLNFHSIKSDWKKKCDWIPSTTHSIFIVIMYTYSTYCCNYY